MTITTIFQILISSMLIYATPLIFTSLGGTFSERSAFENNRNNDNRNNRNKNTDIKPRIIRD